MIYLRSILFCNIFLTIKINMAIDILQQPNFAELTIEQPRVYFTIKQTPVEQMVDITNQLSYNLLHLHSLSNTNNFAFSPCALGSVLIALYEGSYGNCAVQIHETIQLPWDRDVTRIGYRDIHRKLRSYFYKDENLLAGLVLNEENITIRVEYEKILRFYGYDLDQNDINSNETNVDTDMTTTTTTATPTKQTQTEEYDVMTTIPTEIMTTITPMENEASKIITTVKPTTFVMPTTEIPSSTISIESRVDNTRTPTTNIIETTTSSVLSTKLQSTTQIKQTTYPIGTNRFPNTITTQASTQPSPPRYTTPVKIEITTSNKFSTIPSTSSIFSTITTVPPTNPPRTTMYIYTFKPIINTTPLTTLMTRQPITTELPITSTTTYPSTQTDNSILTASTITTTTPKPFISTATTIKQPLPITLDPKNMLYPEEIRSRRIVRLKRQHDNYELLNYQIHNSFMTQSPSPIISVQQEQLSSPALSSAQQQSLQPIYDLPFKFNLNDVSSELLFPYDELFRQIDINNNNYNNYYYTTPNPNVMPQISPPPSTPLNPMPIPAPPISTDDINLPDIFLNFDYRTKFNTNHHNHNRDSDNIYNNDFFYLNTFEYVKIPYKFYNTILRYSDIPTLQASVLEIPLDSNDYNLLIILPNYDIKLEELIVKLKATTAPNLRTIKENLQPHWLQASVPNFQLNGNIILTRDLMKMGIMDIFEPSKADFRIMTEQSGIYTKHIEQSIKINIKTHANNQLRRYANIFYRPIKISVNRPFLFFIMDIELNLSIMSGKILNPLNSRII